MTSREVKIVIDGKPEGQVRAAFTTLPNGRRLVYTPPHPCKVYKRTIELLARQKFPTPLLGPVSVHVLAVFPRLAWDKLPGSAPHTSKPDCDNVAKAVMDALNGVAFVDDAQVSQLTVKKERAALNQRTRTEVTITSLTEGEQ